jgi:outer membrane receptor protein involved in Fe transport
VKLLPRAALAALALAVLLVPVRALEAQAGTGVLEGIVTDSSGAGIPGVLIQIMGTRLSASSADSGHYRISGITPGTYQVRALAIGYLARVRNSVTVAAGAPTRIDLVLAQSAVTMPSVFVTAGSSGAKAGEATVSIATMDSGEVQSRNVTTVDQVLPFIPGVQFNHTTLDIRGASGVEEGVGSRILMMMDGHSVLTGDGGQINFEALPMLDLDRIETVKGAYSALYGSAALGGVINMITTPILAQPQSAIKAYAGAFQVPQEHQFTSDNLNFAGLELQHSRQLGKVGVRLAAGAESNDGYTQNGQVDRLYLRGKFTSAADNPHPWDAFVIGSGWNSGEYFVWRSAQEPNEVPPGELGNWSRENQVLTGATFTPVATQHLTFHISPSVLYSSAQNFFNRPPDADSTWRNDWHNAVKGGANAAVTINAGRNNTVTTGVEGFYTGIRSNFIGRPGILDLSAFGVDEVVLSDRLRGTLGARLDYHSATGSVDQAVFSPTVGVVWGATSWMNVRGSLGHGYRAPSAVEQFVTSSRSGFFVVPNDSLVGEMAWTGEIGATATIGSRLMVDGAAFRSNFHNFIGPAPVPFSVNTFQFQNLSSAMVRGFDLSSRMSVVPRIMDLAVSYMFLDSRDTADAPLPYRSRNTFTTSAEFLRGKIAVDLQYRSRVETVLQFPLDERSAITLVGLRLGYQFRNFNVMAKITNLLQAQYVDVMEHTVGEPRNLIVTVVWGS